MSIKDNLNYVNRKIAMAVQRRREFFECGGREGCVAGYDVTIVAASKYVDAQTIIDARDAGVRVFGENKIQDLKTKYEYIQNYRPDILKDIKFHVIGHLQSNKTRDAVACADLIQSVDSIKLAQKINEQCEKAGKKMEVLIELKTSGEETKTGIPPEEAMELASTINACGSLALSGVMTMAVFDGTADEIRACFDKAYSFFKILKDKYGPGCKYLSMGMSEDFELAIERGANIIRPGRILFK